MKKLILNLTLIAFLATALGAYAAPVPNAQIKALIRKYKAKDYVGCVQDSQTLLKKDPSNAAVLYYQGLSLYQLGRTDKATIAFNAVILLNSNAVLTDYATKAIHCINNDDECKPQTEEGKDSDLDKFINSNKFYGNSVQADLNQKKLNQMKQNINDTIKNNDNQKSEMPTNDEIAEAVKTLAKIGINPFGGGMNGMNPAAMTPESAQMMQMNMLLGNNTNNNQMNMLPMLLMNQENGAKLSPEVIQTMMMSGMSNDFGYGQTY